MAYQYVTLTQTNIDGSISPFANGANGLILLGTGTSTPPQWSSLADANIASLTDLQGYLPLTGGELTGNLVLGTGLSVTAPSFIGNLTGNADTATTAAKVANALSIQLGSGTAQTYDGQQAVSVQVTPAAIGAKADFSWPSAGLMTSGGTSVTPGSIEWPSGSNSDGAYLLVHYKNGAFTNSWDKFAGISSGGGLLFWTGTSTGATLNLLQGSTTGDVLTKTADGYAFQSIGAAIVPPITGLLSGSTDPGKILMVGAASTYSPTWVSLTDVPTGLSAGPAKIDSNGKLTYGAIALNGSEVTNTLPVGKGGTGATSLTGILVGNGANAFSTVSLSGVSSGAFLKYNGSGYEFDTITVPAAPSTIPLEDNDTGAVGTAGTYATATHIHPKPYFIEAAKRLYTPRVIGITGAITAAAQDFDGSNDLMLVATRVDPYALTQPVPIEHGGTGATTASAARTNLGAAASDHNHDTVYLKLSGGSMTGGITFPSTLASPITWPSHSGIAYFGAGELSVITDVSSYVKGNTEFRSYFDDSFSQGSGGGYLERVTLAHTNRKNTTYNIAVGDQEPSGTTAFTRNIKLPAPSADNLGDELTIIFTNKNTSAIGTVNCNCETSNRLVKYDYSTVSSLSWGSGNIVKFVCIQIENNGTTYYWRAIKQVEQSW